MGHCASTDNYLKINGGYVTVNSGGDGIDVNGPVTMTGGVAIVNGPTDNGNGALDYTGSFKVSGGTLIAFGSVGMAEAPGTTSTVNSVMVNLTTVQQAGIMVHIAGTM
jgi:hypothetical protein